MGSGQLSAGVPERVDGAYRVEAELGHGGMARVYRVVDERSGKRLALKHLASGGTRNPTLQAMFEHEYHTLAQLTHPRIVRVFDYGSDADSSYYTMELLEGADARTTLRSGPLSVGSVCLLLRDMASALALIHSRRMVHRDISPRNVWCLPDGHGKLIDFGTLVAMGPQRRIAGTAPFVPPEALYVQPLDARSDMYALGALAYYLLTKRNAYPAREVEALPDFWKRRPRRPDAVRPELPPALCELVMALLSLDPRGRPESAAEVVERLSAIAELPPEDERHAGQAFLTSPTLVGRDDTRAVLRGHLQSAMNGRGRSVAIVAPAGLGRSRMLATAVLDAKVMGAAAIMVDATAAGSGPLAVAAAIAERLIEVMPMQAAAAGERADVLGHVSPALHRALGAPVLAEIPPGDRTRRLGAALLGLFEDAAWRGRLVIAVDDVHRADGASLGVLGRLSLRAAERRLLLVTTCDEEALAHAPPALEQLARADNRLQLEPLRSGHTRELLGSLFGEVAGLDDAASWLHELAQGSPQTCMHYVQHLVDRGIARYSRGRWQLPEQLREQGLPASLGAIFEQRIAQLSDDARALALGLALARDESRSSWQPEIHVFIEDFPALLEGESASARAFFALDELLRVGVLQQRDGYYVLAQRAMIDVLLSRASAAQRKQMHTRLARIFERAVYRGAVLSVRHFQHAGEHDRARAALLSFAVSMAANTSFDWGAMRISVTAEVALAALEHAETAQVSSRELTLLRRLIFVTCPVYDWSMTRFGDAHVAQLRKDCGLVYMERVDPALPDLQRLLECLKLAQQAYEAMPEGERGFAPIDAVRELPACSMALSAAFGSAQDAARARAVPAILAPLRSLSPIVGLLADLCEAGAERVSGRERGERTMELVERLRASAELPDILRVGASGIALHAQAVEDARRGRPRALELAERIASDLGDDMFLALHARWLGHAFRGQSATAKVFRRRAEVITEDDVWRRKAFLFAEAHLHALTGNLIDLGHASDAIGELAERFEGWRPWWHWARAELHRLRGEFEEAQAEIEAALRLAGPGAHRVWIVAAALRADLLLLQGDAAAALHEADAILDAVAAQSLDLAAAVAADRVRALASSRQQEHETARASIDRAISAAHDLGYDGLPLAQLYAAQARIALDAGATSEYGAALGRVWDLIEHTDAPALINEYAALREEGGRLLGLSDMPPGMSAERSLPPESTLVLSEVRTRLNGCSERQARAEQALELLLTSCGAAGGHLMLFDAAGLFVAASIAVKDSGEELAALGQRYLETELGAGLTTAGPTLPNSSRTATATAVSAQRSAGGSRLKPVWLSESDEGRRVLLGLALLVERAAPLRQPRPGLVEAISRCLRDRSDSVGLRVED